MAKWESWSISMPQNLKRNYPVSEFKSTIGKISENSAESNNEEDQNSASIKETSVGMKK